MIAPGMLNDDAKTAHEAQSYAYQLNSAIIPVSVDDEGIATSLLTPGDNETALITFSRPQFVRAVIGMRLGLNLVGYEDTDTDHAFPAAFPPEKQQGSNRATHDPDASVRIRSTRLSFPSAKGCDPASACAVETAATAEQRDSCFAVAVR